MGTDRRTPAVTAPTGSKLALSRRHVAEGEARYLRQREIVRDLAEQRGPPLLLSLAEDLLAALWATQAQFRLSLAREEDRHARCHMARARDPASACPQGA